MTYDQFLNTYKKAYKWFAWYPVYTEDTKRYVWWMYVTRVVDESPEVYLGLLPEITYYENEI